MTARDLALPGWGLAALAGAMALAWLRQRRTQNAGLVDVLWAAGIGALGSTYALLADGWAPRRLLVGTLVALWSARLTWHLARRVGSEPEDGRYARLRARLGARAQSWLFWFFQAQALLAVLLTLPVLLLATAERVGWRWTDGLAVLLFAVSWLGESAADRQLQRWRSAPEHRGRTCRAGLWRWSRHPNYFFEWLHWLVYPLLALGLPYGWTLWAAPVAMGFLVTRVTGIPPTEEQAVANRGDDYRAYQRTTNAFFPGPTRPDPEAPRTASAEAHEFPS